MTEKPSEWIAQNFYVHDPRDPITDESFPPGPILLADHQKRIIDEALSRNEDGTFKYSTIIYSAPKKSGKSALSSAVALYMAYTYPNSYIACVANDGKQADDRLYGPIQTCFRLHNQLGGIFKGIRYTQREATLRNFTKIEPINVDASSEAGSQPRAVFFSEIWGYTTPKKLKLFTELTIPPTLYGHAIQWIESYAGFTGESEILEQLYETGFVKGLPHPDFNDLQGRDGPVVRVNESAGMFTYWDTEPRMVWQVPAYYAQQEQKLAPSEFQRIHRNQWVSPATAFIQPEWWDACHTNELPILQDGDRTPVVVGIDMAVSRDCAALIAVTRNPFEPSSSIAVRAARIFSPKQSGGIIDQELLIRPVIEDWARRWNVICWVYDPKEMAKLAQDLSREGLGWFRPFGQVNPRAVSDKQLHDMIMHRQIAWNKHTTYGEIGDRGNPNETLYNHITKAGAITRNDAYRLEKLSASTHIDGAVALSQAAYIALQLNIDNREYSQEELIRKLQKREITLEEFSQRVQSSHAKLRELSHE